MRSRSFAVYLFAGLVALLASGPAFAVCNPSNTTEVSCLKAADKSCAQLGSSTMDKDQKNIIACLKNDSGTLEWKAMSSAGSTTPTTRIVTATKTAWRWASATATCANDEVVTGGGGSCTGGAGFNFIHSHGPSGNGWNVGCDTPVKQNNKATVYAVCVK